MKQNIAIIGNGLTGMATAHMLCDAGYEVVLIGKRMPVFGGVQLAPNGLAALQKIGLDKVCAKKAVHLQAVVITAMQDGRELAEISHQDKRDYIAIGRADLQASLEKQLATKKNLFFAQSPAVAIRWDGNKMQIILQDGQLIYADEVIGADGAYGLTRTFVNGAELQAETAPFYALRAEINSSLLPRLFSRPQTQLMLGDGCHFVSYPIAGGKKVNMVFCVAADRLTPNWQSRYLHPHPTLKYLAEQAINWVKVPLYPSPPLASWRRSKVTLIGDAAHVMPPHLAQGAGQSFEDIAYLKTKLDTKDLPQSLWEMAVGRASQVKAISSKAGLTGQMMRLSGLPRHLRDHMLGLSGVELIENWLCDVWKTNP